MSDVRKWLETIGLAQYADIFESNDLDIDLLRQVDDQILKDIDVIKRRPPATHPQCNSEPEGATLTCPRTLRGAAR